MCSLRLWSDRQGVISWLLSQMGLLLAVGVLMSTIAGITLYSDWEKETEAANLASHLAATIECMDLHTFPGRKTYIIPSVGYPCRITISSDYVTVSRSDSLMGKNITVRESLLIHPWVAPPQTDGYGAQGLYNYLGMVCGGGRNGSSPHQKAPVETVEEMFSRARNLLAVHPCVLDQEKPLYVEKAFVHTTGGMKKYVLVYQR